MISVLLPTRGRPQNMVDLVESVERTALGETEVIFYIDEDDDGSIEQATELDCRTVIGPRITMSDCYNKCADVAGGDILMECCDAVLFHTRGWDRLVADEFYKVPDRIALVHCADGVNTGQAALPFIHRRWVDTLGRFTPPYFSADWCDTWLWEVARQLNRLVYLPHVLIQHRHPIAGTAPIDQTYSERLERGVKDDVAALYRSLEPERQGDVEKLRAVVA